MNINKLPKIYALIDPISKEVRYVGQTIRHPFKRLSDHISKYNSYNNLYFKHWISKLLKNNLKSKIIVLEYNAIWNESEIKWIKKCKNIGCRLVNATDGGEGMLGYKHSDKAKRKLSRIRKGKKLTQDHREKIIASLIGRSMHENTRKGLRQANIGKPKSRITKDKISKAHCKKVICIETNIIYNSVKMATQETGIWNIANCCRGLYKSAGGFTWRYV